MLCDFMHHVKRAIQEQRANDGSEVELKTALERFDSAVNDLINKVTKGKHVA